MTSRPSFMLTGPYDPDGRGGGKLIEFPNRKDDDMTIEELHAQTNAKIVKIIERIEAMVSKRDGLAEAVNERVDQLKENLGDMFSRLDSKVDVAIGRLDVMDEVNVSLNDRIEAMRVSTEAWRDDTDAAINSLQAQGDHTNMAIGGLRSLVKLADEKQVAMGILVAGAAEALKRIEEMRGDVEMCKSAIRDLDSIRDSATRAANQVAGFEPRLSQMEESFAAFQTLRHDADSPRPDETLARSDGG